MLALMPSLDAGSPVNRAHPCNRGLVAWYLASPAGHPSFYGGGRFLDLCGRHHGTITNATWDGPRGRRAGWGAVNFNGANARVEVADTNALDLGTGDVTITAWIRATTVGTDFRTFLSKYSDVNLAWQFALSDNVPRTWTIGNTVEGELFFNCLDTTTIGYNGQTLDDDTWHHCGFGRTGTTHDLWIDGKKVSTGTATAQDMSGSANVWLGALQYTSGLQWYAGLMDDVRIQSAYVSIAEIYRESLAGYPSMLSRARRGLLADAVAAATASLPFRSGMHPALLAS